MGGATLTGLGVPTNTRRAGKAEWDPLAHPHRAAIVSALVRGPGASRSEIAREVGLSRGGVRYHLRVLVEAGCVRCFQRGHVRSYALDSGEAWPLQGGAGDVAVADFFHAVQHPLRRAVLRAVHRRADAQQLRQRLQKQGLKPPDPATLSKHCIVLQKAGLLHRQRAGRRVYWHAPHIPSDWELRHVKAFLMRSGFWNALSDAEERTQPPADGEAGPARPVIDPKRARRAVEALGLVAGGANEGIARNLRAS